MGRGAEGWKRKVVCYHSTGKGAPQILWPSVAFRVSQGAFSYCLRSSVSDLENAITTSSAPWSMECCGSRLSWLLTTPA